MNSYIGQLLDDRYELLEVIGTGGMAVVYKARCHRLNRFVAVKVLKDEFSGDEEFRRRFRAEGEAVAMLSHPNIVQVFDVSSADNAYFIVMELIDGISLKQYMEVKGILNWKETLHFASQIAKGLEHAHSRGIVHRDIKPHNVMVLKNGSVKVMDFGIAQVMNKASTLTKEALGSVHYISPEQAKGSYTDNRSDIYSLGVVMYEMMAGRPPYDGESPVAVAIQHINGGAKLPSVYNPNIPAGLEQIIMHCMALDAKNRYADAAQLLADLEEFRKNPSITFPYHIPVEDTTRTMKPVQQPKPRNTAERVVQSKGGKIPAQPAQRPTGNTGKIHSQTGKLQQPTTRDQDAIRRARARREEEARIERERSKVATIAVVACSAVAMIALVVFLAAIFNGAILNQEKDLTEVPYLIGTGYSEDLGDRYPDFVLRLQPQQYDDYYQKGQIMKQEPAGGEKVSKGTDLFITVSMGEEPAVKVMEDLTGVTVDRAQSFLLGQGYKPLVREEPSDDYAVGQVIRTEPAADTELVDGQTIKLWISNGPKTLYAKMPDVVTMEKDSAVKVLELLNFRNVTVVSVPSDKAKDQVVGQNIQKDTEIDVTTEIILEISEGPKVETHSVPNVLGMSKEDAVSRLKTAGFGNVVMDYVESSKARDVVVTQNPQAYTEQDVTAQILLEISEGPKETQAPPAPTTPVNTSVSARVTFIVPSRPEAYELSIFHNGNAVVSGVQIPAGEIYFITELSGTGTQEYDLFINGDFFQTQKVMFSDNG